MVSVVSPESVVWTREALEHLYDLSYLSRCLKLPEAANRFTDARALQAALSGTIQQVKPSPEVPTSSLAWRIYNALHYRYVRGLSQAEAAAELNISLRQLRREQDRGIEAVATLLFTTPPAPDTRPRDTDPGGSREYTRLDDVLLSVLKLLDPLLSQHNLTAQLVLPEPVPAPWVNRMALRQLFIMAITALVRVAFDATLQVSGRHEEGCFRLTMRVPSSPGAQQDGDMPEISVLHQLASAAGVTLAQASFNADIGSGHDDGADSIARSVQVLLPTSARKRVLMVDDSEDSIELNRRHLEKTPYELIGVTSPEEALSQAQTLQPASIILDVMMPRHDGWEILSLLKAHPETRRIPVIVSSVLKNQDLAHALGAEAVLPKPHTAEQLVAVLGAVTG